MSLGIAIKGPEGIVLAADSRVTLQAQSSQGPPLLLTFDNATKLLSFAPPHDFVGAVTYGAAVIGQRTAHSFLPELASTLPAQRVSVLGFAQHLSDFFLALWNQGVPAGYTGPGMHFIVGGYDPDAPYGRVFLFEVPYHPQPQPQNENDFGMTWGGQLEVVSRLVHGYDPKLNEILRSVLNLNDQQVDAVFQTLAQNLEFRVPYAVLPLQDCVDLATFLIRATITAQALSVGVRGVGGPIEVATITRTEALTYIQRKTIRGELK